MAYLGKDVWSIIADALNVQSLLCLRQTCRGMNTIVKNMNERWYREYQWFIIRKGSHSKVKSAVKKHIEFRSKVPVKPGTPHTTCIPFDHPTLLAFKAVHGHHHALVMTEKQRMITDGEFLVSHCKDRSHWTFVVPNKLIDIPVDKCNPQKSYIYHYLIECFRHNKQVHQHRLSNESAEFEKLKRRKTRLLYELKNIDPSIKLAEDNVNSLKRKYVDNTIFENKRIDIYKGI
jgi:hypothetical protein